jgi:hypothetical protein
MCDALIELGYSRVRDLFMTVLEDMKTYEAPVTIVPKGPGKYVNELRVIAWQAGRVVHGKEHLRERFGQQSEEEASALRQLDEIIQQIQRDLQNPLTKLAARNLKPGKLQPIYRELANGAGMRILSDLIRRHEKIRSRLGNTCANLQKLSGGRRKKELGQTKPSPSVHQMSCVSIDMARYSLLARQIQATQEAKALFDFNRKLQEQFRRALAAAGAKPDRVPIDDTGDGALVFMPDATTAVKFAVEVQKASFVKNLGIPNKEWQQNLRIGIDTGEVMMDLVVRDGDVMSFNSAGVPIINAVRIQSKCPVGEIAVSRPTWGKLDSGLQGLFGKFRSPKSDKKKHEPALEMCVTKPGASLCSASS